MLKKHKNEELNINGLTLISDCFIFKINDNTLINVDLSDEEWPFEYVKMNSCNDEINFSTSSSFNIIYSDVIHIVKKKRNIQMKRRISRVLLLMVFLIPYLLIGLTMLNKMKEFYYLMNTIN